MQPQKTKRISYSKVLKELYLTWIMGLILLLPHQTLYQEGHVLVLELAPLLLIE